MDRRPLGAGTNLRRAATVGLVSAAALLLQSPPTATASCLPPRGTPCADLTPPTVPGATVLNMTTTELRNVTTSSSPAASNSTIDVCSAELFLTHGDAGDEVRVLVWMPLHHHQWNGRWQGTGGGGFLAGRFEENLLPAVAGGYAAGSTDAGHTEDGSSTWADDAQLVDNFVYLSLHDMTVAGKAVTEEFYGGDASSSVIKKSYWNGCSTGGRQGLSEAQRYPGDYDGILAEAPAVNWDRFVAAELWPHLVQVQETGAGDGVALCDLGVITNASVAWCDGLDGAADGLIVDPTVCDFDAQTLVNQSLQGFCDGELTPITVSQLAADVWASIRSGARDLSTGEPLWYGIPAGASYAGLATLPVFDVVQGWYGDFLTPEDDPDYDIDDINYDNFTTLFRASEENYRALWGTDDPDLGDFAARGGKMLTWHGWADELIFPQGLLEYWERVVEVSGGGDAAEVDDFYRVFMAPGVGHCSGGYGPAPVDPLAALVAWVERGEAPETLRAEGFGMARELCKHPKKLRYKTEEAGEVELAESWTCV